MNANTPSSARFLCPASLLSSLHGQASSCGQRQDSQGLRCPLGEGGRAEAGWSTQRPLAKVTGEEKITLLTARGNACCIPQHLRMDDVSRLLAAGIW